MIERGDARALPGETPPSERIRRSPHLYPAAAGSRGIYHRGAFSEGTAVIAPGSPWILTSQDIDETSGDQVGGKALALAALTRAGLQVPAFTWVSAGA